MAQRERKPAFSDAEIFRFVKEFVEVLAQELGISAHRIFGAMRRQVPRGKPGRPPRSPNRTRPLIDLENERVKTIIAMRKQWKPFREIGAAVGITHQRVHQIVTQIRIDHGEETFASDFLSLFRAAQRLRVNCDTLRRRCRRGAVPCEKISGRYYFTPEQLRQLLEGFVLKRQCVICGAQFTTIKSLQKICGSANCKERWPRERWRHFTETTPNPETSPPRLRELLERLEGRAIPENEE